MVRKAEDGTIRVDDISELRPNLTERNVFRVQQPDAAGRATLETRRRQRLEQAPSLQRMSSLKICSR